MTLPFPSADNTVSPPMSHPSQSWGWVSSVFNRPGAHGSACALVAHCTASGLRRPGTSVGRVGHSRLSPLGPLGAPAPAAPLFPKSLLGQSQRHSVAALRTRGIPPPTPGIPPPIPGVLVYPCARPPTPSPAAARRRLASIVGTTGTRAGPGRQCLRDQRARWARPAVSRRRLERPSRCPGADLPAAGPPGVQQLQAGAARGVRSRSRLCACARRGDGARAGRAARAAGRGGGGGGLGPDGDRGRRCGGRTGGDSRRD